MKSTFDRENLKQVILDFPGQFSVGAKAAGKIEISGSFLSVTISGMGGSALPADVLDTIIDNSPFNKKIPVYINRNYSLNWEARATSLNFFASYSGNTEETLSDFREALAKKLPCVCFASGGKLAELSRKNNVPLVIIPSDVQPRYALGYFIGAMLQVLENSHLLKGELSELLAIKEKLQSKSAKYESLGKYIAAKVKGNTPVIYATDRMGILAKIWKIKINENSKTPAFWNVIPEMNHNEMVGFTLPQAKFIAIFLIDPEDHSQNIKRMKVTANLLRKHWVKSEMLTLEKGSFIERFISAIILGDWISYYLALAYRQDPTPVVMVENFKKKLK